MSTAAPRCYQAINRAVLDRVPAGAKRLLDVGCGTGAFGRSAKASRSCEVVGLNHSESEAVIARTVLDTVITCDLNRLSLPDLGQFDCIICSHVLEHLNEPERLLDALHLYLAPGGRLIVAVPNILHWKQRMKFLGGKFRYTSGGLMDSTHFRFFDWQSATQLIKNAGYVILERTAEGNFPLPFVRRVIPFAAARVDRWACGLRPGFFGWQFVIVAKERDANDA